ncbi:MAG: hypothetical protein ABSA23_02725 [Anaerolineales bacterium]|jgi:hypothetical protein
MKESQFLGTLLPSHPDFLPIEQAIREKYGLYEVNPEDDPSVDIFREVIAFPVHPSSLSA